MAGFADAVSHEPSYAYSGLMEGHGRREHAALISLLMDRPSGVKEADIVADVIGCGSALEIWQNYMPATLMPVPGESNPLELADRTIAKWESLGLTLLTILDQAYPARLRGVHDAPPVLFARGRVIADDIGVSVVGSRKASDRGLEIATSIATELANLEISVIAGLAAGIDTAAHKAALAAGGRTVALIGTGILHAYPAANRALHEEIAEKGLLLSQFWPEATARPHTFLMRNATMSGYGLATVVVEAGEKSGTRAQARMAIAHGRPVILTDLVVEKNQWAQDLIGRPGVHVASGIKDIIKIVSDLRHERSRIEDALNQLVSV